MSDSTDPEKKPPFELIETMLYSHSIRYLEDHLARLRGTAAHFEIPLPEKEIREQLHAIQASLKSNGRTKVRLTVRPGGAFNITTASIHPQPVHPRRVCLSPYRVDSSDPFFYHKTTKRVLYENEYTRARDAGYFEILFFNEQESLTEGSRSNVLLNLAGSWYTPPVSSGLLAGVYRHQLLKRCSLLNERILSFNDLMNADRIYVCNAIQGLQRVSGSPDWLYDSPTTHL